MAAGPLLAHLTEVDAVNEILASIGEDAISQLTDADDLADASLALRKLRNISREVQMQGWDCNTSREKTININASNQFAVSVNTLKVDTVKEDSHVEVSMRRTDDDTTWVLYDHENNSLTWSGRSTLKVDEVTYLPFDELTVALQHYIMYRAGHEFQKSSFASVRLFEFTQDGLNKALQEAEAEESENNDTNVLKMSRSVFDTVWRRNMLFGR